MNSLMKKLAVVVLGGSLLGSMPMQAITPQEMLSSMPSQEMLSNLLEQTTKVLLVKMSFDRKDAKKKTGLFTNPIESIIFEQTANKLMSALRHFSIKAWDRVSWEDTKLNWRSALETGFSKLFG